MVRGLSANQGLEPGDEKDIYYLLSHIRTPFPRLTRPKLTSCPLGSHSPRDTTFELPARSDALVFVLWHSLAPALPRTHMF
jgi:hypothetical protein